MLAGVTTAAYWQKNKICNLLEKWAKNFIFANAKSIATALKHVVKR
jgi:hypothetical protein